MDDETRVCALISFAAVGMPVIEMSGQLVQMVSAAAAVYSDIRRLIEGRQPATLRTCLGAVLARDRMPTRVYPRTWQACPVSSLMACPSQRCGLGLSLDSER